MKLNIHPIGIIHSEFNNPNSMPIQSIEDENSSCGTVVLYKKYINGLYKLKDFSHIYLIYYFHKIRTTKLTVMPFLDSNKCGIFATRAPSRPNKVGISIVRLISIDDNIIYIKDVDILDSSPLIDIKPYVKQFDNRNNAYSGWLNNLNLDTIKNKKSDDRFIK